MSSEPEGPVSAACGELAEEELVRRIMVRDPEALDYFVEKYHRKFVLIASRHGISWPDSEDVAQRALTTAIDQMERNLFRRDSRLSTWLHTIVKGKIIDHQRARHPEFSGVSLDALKRPSMALALSTNRSNAYQTVHEVREILDRMRPELRHVLVLYYYMGFTLEDLTGFLGNSLSSVYERLKRAEDAFARLYHQPRRK